MACSPPADWLARPPRLPGLPVRLPCGRAHTSMPRLPAAPTPYIPCTPAGLTERPRVGPGSGASPYTVASQAHLVLSLCQALGLKRVVLVGQADGCLVALMAASLAARGAALQAQQQAQSGNGHAAQQQLPGAVSIDMTAEVGSPAPPSTSALPANSDLSWMGSYGPDPTPRALNNVLHALRGLAAQQAWSQDSGSFHSACGPPSSSAASLGAGGDASGAAQAPGVASSAASSSAALAALTPATAALGAAGQASEAGASSTSSEAGPQPPRAPPQGGGRGDSPGSAWIAPDVPEMCREAEGGEEIRSIGSSVSSLAGSAVLREPPQIAGLVLLHPNLSGHLVSAFARLLSKTQLGRSMLRPLLRTEIGEVANRRAWHNSEQLTREVLELYKRPLRVCVCMCLCQAWVWCGVVPCVRLSWWVSDCMGVRSVAGMECACGHALGVCSPMPIMFSHT